ncbi:MAG: HD domain-containing protein [Desulfurivibrio sp.]|nr:HD domain-containing protein [Desulfurivibrio sp.]MBU4033833.1 HD domain-containing protein [Pseudomonadota bacterium]
MQPEANPKTHIELYPLLSSITAATDLISPVLVDHHKKVSFVAATIGKTLGLDEHSLRRLILAAAVHDIGGLSIKTRVQTFEFELTDPDRHTLPGYSLLSGFEPFADLAKIIRFHHVYWQDGQGTMDRGKDVPLLSHLVHLSDRIAVQLAPNREILNQKKDIVQRITTESGEMFVPDQVEAFLEVAGKEVFWLDLVSPSVNTILQQRFPLGGMDLDRGELLDLAEMFRRVIDFRSRFTATHSSGVSAVAVALANHSGFKKDDPDRMKIAGLMHDIGKLVVPPEILEKRQGLTSEDLAIIYKHPYYTAEILRGIEAFDDIGLWGSLHHERLDGTGYPYKKAAEEIPEGARILSVADTFTALMEDRPYRCGVSASSTDRIMRDMAAYHKLDEDFVGLLYENAEEINDKRYEAQTAADQTHRHFLEESRLLDNYLEADDRCPVNR